MGHSKLNYYNEEFMSHRLVCNYYSTKSAAVKAVSLETNSDKQKSS